MMKLAHQIIDEVLSMFVADKRLAVAILCLVACVAGTTWAVHSALLAGAFLIFGCLVILSNSVRCAAKGASRNDA
jgi:hypothetical protein